MQYRYTIGLSLLACALLVTTESPLAQVPQLEFRDFREMRGSPIATRPAVGSPPIVREQQTSPGTARRQFDSSLGPPIARIGLDAQGLLAATEMPVGQMLQSGSPLVEFEIGDYFLRMAIVERVVDQNFDALHYTLVDPNSPDYARLTITGNGTELVGTVFRDREEYRILPEADGHQLVHPVIRFRGQFRRASGPELETRAGRLEARHLQMAWFAERRPERFQTAADGRLSNFRSGPTGNPALGRIDIFAAMQADANGRIATDAIRLSAAVEDFLDDIRHITLLDDPVQVNTGMSDLNGIFEGRASVANLVFTQHIDGVPVGGNSRVEIDRTGDVHEFIGTLIDRSTAERGRNTISEQLAESTSLDAFRKQIGVDLPLEVRRSELRYAPSDDATRQILIWRIVLGSSRCRPEFRVDVRALTGDIEYVGVDLQLDTDTPPETLRSMCP